jgi:hypothetical protein
VSRARKESIKVQPRSLRRRALIAAAVALAAGCALPAFATAEAARPPGFSASDSLAPVVARIVAEQDPRVGEALARMEGEGRRLLALRSYLRSKTRLAERWSWTADQVAAYQATPEHADLQAEVERVRATFAQDNPGFELWVNPQVRNLDIQLQNWNSNESVAAAAEALLTSARALAGSPEFRRANAAGAQRALEQFLASHVPVPTPTIAAPGLSPHGQLRAIDFQVHKDGAIVAGTRTATIAQEWDGAGWTQKLEAAVRTASRRFVGPLETPREPWHYTYAPDSVAAQ